MAVSHLVPSSYINNFASVVPCLVSEGSSRSDTDISPQFRSDVVVGFAALFLMVRSYENNLVGEISQQLYGGILRTIALELTH